jgi:segregation and condensation protein A
MSGHVEPALSAGGQVEVDNLDASYQVRLDQFEGPLDLLLHLIKQNEINIYDIPIALITKQYLEYISVMKSLDLEVAGAFLVMAATLIHIKSRMLLPVEPQEDEEDGEDPRAELVRRLLLYKQFKEAAGELEERGRLWREAYARPLMELENEIVEEDAPLDMTLFDLVDAFQDILRLAPTKSLVELTPEHLTVKDRMNYILERLEEAATVTFEELFRPEEGRLVLIVTFLALLELIRIKLVRAFQSEVFGSVLLSRAFLPATTEDIETGENQP